MENVNKQNTDEKKFVLLNANMSARAKKQLRLTELGFTVQVKIVTVLLNASTVHISTQCSIICFENDLLRCGFYIVLYFRLSIVIS